MGSTALDNKNRTHDSIKYHKYAEAQPTSARNEVLRDVKLRHKNLHYGETNSEQQHFSRTTRVHPKLTFSVINDSRGEVNETMDEPLANLSGEKHDIDHSDADEMCLHPEYLVYTWVLSLIALASTLKLYFLVKTMLAVIMVMLYASCILIFYSDVFVAGKFNTE